MHHLCDYPEIWNLHEFSFNYAKKRKNQPDRIYTLRNIDLFIQTILDLNCNRICIWALIMSIQII